MDRGWTSTAFTENERLYLDADIYFDFYDLIRERTKFARTEMQSHRMDSYSQALVALCTQLNLGVVPSAYCSIAISARPLNEEVMEMKCEA